MLLYAADVVMLLVLRHCVRWRVDYTVDGSGLQCRWGVYYNVLRGVWEWTHETNFQPDLANLETRVIIAL